MTQAKGPIYLARGSEVAGPFGPEQIAEMKASGDLYEYGWIWDGSGPDWAPVIPAPSGPPSLPSAHSPPRLSSQQETDPHAAAPLLAVCHDFRNLMSGKVVKASERGCVILGRASRSPLSPFKKGMNAWLNLLDESSGGSENLPIRIESCVLRGLEWEVTVSWEKTPQLVAL